MPGRKHKLLNGEIYHIYNKTLASTKIFVDDDICSKFLATVSYYRSSALSMRFSNFQKLTYIHRRCYEEKTNSKSTFRISILAFCLMSTHYHFLLRQNQENGISFFMSQIQNSLTRYINIKKQKIGQIFLDRFKSKHIHNEQLLKHVSRYIHLNPFSGQIVGKKKLLIEYPWSSLPEYLGLLSNSLCETEKILDLFGKNPLRYKRFVFDNAAHQKMLEYCKYTNKL